MRNKIVNFLIILGAILTGSALTYILIANPFTKEEQAGSLGCQYTACENKVIIENNGIASAVDKAYDAVVMIKNYQKNTLAGTGSGFVYKTDKSYGYIMTNYHVIEDASEITITTTKEEDIKAELLGGDEYIDIAVLRIPLKDVVAVAEIASTSDLKLGDFVFTIGTPVGEEYFNSITSGVISGLDRKVTVSINSNSDWIMNVIQVDAAINPGNSGGPLLNANGQVIGVNSLKLSNTSIENMGFSIKIEDAMAHVETFENGQEIQRPMLGISMLNVTDTYSLRGYGITLDKSITYGIVVVSVVNGSGAAKAGLEKGDVITAINGEKVDSNANLKYLLYKYNVGDTVSITYNRSGKVKTAKLVLSKSTN